MVTLLFASLMGLYYWFARLRLGYTFSAMLLQPVVVAACIAIPIAVKANMDPNLAIALAIPFGVIGVFLDQLRRTLNAA
ncbi:PTS sugar transporter subunit IIC, partial [Escherichia coli]|uniref:PTS sugar transporter subunit IIC n=1 Tax=Escherichia coli TaxID=562 RepID=UPI000A93F5C7